MLRWITARGPRVTLVLATLVAIFHGVNELRVLAGGPANFVQRLELTALDVRLAFRGPRRPPQWRVAVVAIDEKALQRFGPLPWPRTVHGALVDALTARGAGAIAFDMTFDRPSGGPGRAALEGVGAAYRTAGLQGAAEALRTTTDVLRSAEQGARAPAAARLAQAARTVGSVTEGLTQFEDALEAAIDGGDPDAAFASSIQASGRVVLGAVAYSQREAEALGRQGPSGGLRGVATSTISTLAVDDGSGLTRLVDGRGHFRSGLYRRYFDVRGPTERLAAATPHFGLINASPDEDGVNRRMPLLAGIKGSGVVLPSLALKAVEVASGPAEIEVVGDPRSPAPDLVRVGPISVSTELGASVMLDWTGPFDPKRFPIFSVVDILDGRVEAAQIEDRVVFVAATAIGTHDQRVTPLEPAVPGVYIHATVAQNLLEGRRLSRPPYVVFLELLILVGIGAIAGGLMARVGLRGQIGLTLLLAVAWGIVNQLLFLRGLVVVTVLPLMLIFGCLLVMSMWSYLVEQRERRQTRRAFGQYLSPQVLDKVLAEPEEYLKLGGRRYEATVLFSDIRGFTTISEALTPEALGRFLNEYMTPMTDIVFRHQGTLDKYIGDAVMAFWGAPVAQPDHALRACRAAIEMHGEVDRINRQFAEEGLPKIAIGIGLSSGPMTIGNMGSDDHFAYTALGDRVNLGARLESQTKAYGVGVMISEATYRQVANDMLGRELGALRVKGKSEPVGIFELIGPHEESGDRVPFVDAFHRGLALFRNRQWDDAIAAFEDARRLNDGDPTSDLYVKWCAAFKERPPPDDWDGVHTAAQK